MSMAVHAAAPSIESGIGDAGVTVDVQVVASFEQAPAGEWDELIRRLNGSLYMTPLWCRVWWRHYGSGRELRLFVVRDGERLAGVLPFFVDTLGLAFGRARVAKLVGSDFTNAMVDPPVEPGVAVEACATAIRRLVEDDRCDIVQIGPISGAAPQREPIRRAAQELDGVAQVIRDRDSGSHTVFELPDGFDAYLKGLSKNQRSNYRRNVNKLKNAFYFEVDVVRDGPALRREFEAFVEMHQAQWKAVNKLGHFGDWPKSLDYTRDLVDALTEPGNVRLIRLLADGEVVSYYFCFELNGTYYWRLPARLTGERWDAFALGRVGLMKMLEAAAAEGATAIEAGTGRYEYKDKLNAKSLPVHSIALCRRGFSSRCRARVALAAGELLNLAYYRLWFGRVAPRLGLPLRPLWRSWIRSRF
jgi:CelD/BcsL family acetyltransferase involved in cellulose biosynthesis